MSEKINDGGPAFPGPCQSETKIDINEGLSLRDYFAVRASSDDIINHRTYSIDNDSTYGRRIYTMTVEQAKYAYADAMLKARQS